MDPGWWTLARAPWLVDPDWWTLAGGPWLVGPDWWTLAGDPGLWNTGLWNLVKPWLAESCGALFCEALACGTLACGILNRPPNQEQQEAASIFLIFAARHQCQANPFYNGAYTLH